MQVEHLTVSNFRCFEKKTFTIQRRVVLVEGNNGAGKTTLLEALYYSCYLRSFRTHLGRELVSFEKDHFFLQVAFDHEALASRHEIQVGVSGKTKLVKFDSKAIQSHKEIVQYYRVIALTEDDVSLIKGSPDGRRLFLDQALVLSNPSLIAHMKEYKKIMLSRNALLARHGSKSDPQLMSWTEQLWKSTVRLQEARISYIAQLQKQIDHILASHGERLGEEVGVKLVYEKKNLPDSEDFALFWSTLQVKGTDALEMRYGRSLFGAHLDDLSISFNSKKARMFASRGQQKLVVFLIKIAQMQLLEEQNRASCLLLDDFLTDFDEKRLSWCLHLLQEICGQIFIACPLKSYLRPVLRELFDVQTITL